MLVRFVITVVAAIGATAASLPNAWQDQTSQTTLNICPELSVKCVVDGDWRNPIGYLGKRRMCEKSYRTAHVCAVCEYS